MSDRIDYTDAEGINLARYFREKYEQQGWKSQVKFGEYAGLHQMTVSRLYRSIPISSASFNALVLYSLALDTPIQTLLDMLRLEDKVKGHIQDPKYSRWYTNLRYLVEAPMRDPMDQVLARVPDHKRRQARRLIETIIESFNE